MHFSILLLQQFIIIILIKKFYPSIPHDGLKECIRKKIKDKDFLIILDEIIDSTDSVRNTSSKITKYDWRIYVKNRKENVKPQT